MNVIDAIMRKDLAALKRALAEGASPDQTQPGLSALQLAAYQRFTEGVDALLAAGARPDVWAAAALGDASRIRALVQADASLLMRAGPDGFPPLHLAAHFGRSEALRELLALGAIVDGLSGPPLVNTALHAAAAGGGVETAESLLAAGARTDIFDANGYLALHVAAASGEPRLVRAMLERGAEAAARSREGKTALEYAVAREKPEVAALLRAQ